MSDKPKVVIGNGNAYCILAKCMRSAKRAGWPDERWAKVQQEMMAGDYQHLLSKAREHFDVSLENVR